MKRKSSRKNLGSMCGQPGPDDGLDPRTFFKPARNRQNHRKDWQLCRQVFETLSYVLSGESHDEILRNLIVCEVVPAPDATHLLVTVRPLIIEDGLDPVLILQQLQVASRRLRSEVAASISRRKAPELAFRVVMVDPSDPRSAGVDQ